MECKDRNNRSSIMLPYSFLPTMAARKLRDAADKVRASTHVSDHASAKVSLAFEQFCHL